MNSIPPPQPSLKNLLIHFEWTVDRFEEILKNEKTDYFRDAALQRFSFTCDMALKCIRSLAAEQGKTCETFQQCVEWTAEQKWMEDDTPFNEISASYSRASKKLEGESANLEYEKLDSYCRLLKNIYKHIKLL